MDDNRRSYYTVFNISTTRGPSGHKNRIQIIVDILPSLIPSCRKFALKYSLNLLIN